MYNLDDFSDSRLLYMRVIRESTHVEDLRRFLNAQLLMRLWPQLVLPPRVRALWENRFPSLGRAAADGTVRLWDPVTGRPAGAPLHASAQYGVHGVAFSPDGKLLASADADGTVRLWEVPLFAHPYAALCAYVGPPTPQEWNQYASGVPQPKVCG